MNTFEIPLLPILLLLQVFFKRPPYFFCSLVQRKGVQWKAGQFECGGGDNGEIGQRGKKKRIGHYPLFFSFFFSSASPNFLHPHGCLCFFFFYTPTCQATPLSQSNLYIYIFAFLMSFQPFSPSFLFLLLTISNNTIWFSPDDFTNVTVNTSNLISLSWIKQLGERKINK